jgi:hypothetical protein
MDKIPATPKKVQENVEPKKNIEVAPKISQTLPEQTNPRTTRFRSLLNGFL